MISEERFRAFGDELRRAREARGRALDDIASQTKINRRHLEAIEAGDLARLPQGPYVKAFVREYARALDVPVPQDFAVPAGGPPRQEKDPKVMSRLVSETAEAARMREAKNIPHHPGHTPSI